jgi:FixJ family two-component response regulator
LLLDVTDPVNGIDRFHAERNLVERAHDHPVLIVTGPEDIDRSIRLTERR